MTTDLFQGIARWNVEKTGTTRCLPYLYYDLSSVAAVYTASTGQVRKLLPHSDLRPIELVPGRCLVAFAGFEYRKTDQDPYNEFNISFLVSYRRRPIPLVTLAGALNARVIPSYVWQLPVTTEQARAGGVDLFGYPKFIADIQFARDQNRVICTLSEAGSEILRMTGRALPTKRGKPIRYVTYAAGLGALTSTNFVVAPHEFGESRHKSDLALEIGAEHAICHTLDGIKLSRHPLLYQYCPRGEAILFPSRNLKDG
jgi:hypothetical protein